MVVQRMTSERVGDGSDGGAQPHSRTRTRTANLNSIPLSGQGSFYTLTIDEVQNQLGDFGRPLGTMNLDDLLKALLIAEANNQSLGDADYGPPVQRYGSSLNRQSMLSRDLCKKTVDEVWHDIQQKQERGNLHRNTCLGTMTLEEFLVKAGVVVQSPLCTTSPGSILRSSDSMILPQQPQCLNVKIPSISHRQQHSTLPDFVPGYPVQPIITVLGNPIIDAAYSETQVSMSLSPLMDNISDAQTTGRKRVDPGDIAEKTVERRQKRMIKNRESAARSRARKQAYTHELENKVSRLVEENERLKRQKVGIEI